MRTSRRVACFLVPVVAAAAAAAGVAPESAAHTPRGEVLRVMSFNVWLGGSRVDDGLGKQVAAIRRHRADVVALQETAGHSARDIAGELGWDYYQAEQDDGDLGIVSRFPITGPVVTTRAAAGVRLRLGDGRQVEVWTAHLWYEPYGPWDACFRKVPVRELLRGEEHRADEAREIAAELAPRIAAGGTVVLAGDFNAPSHLDWTKATRQRHCGYGPVPWPATKTVQEAGLTDSFRQVHPDPGAVPGNTWSPVTPVHDGSVGPEGAPEPQDRIDYIHYAGPALRAVDSRTVVDGRPRPFPDVWDNLWPSDHAAVLTTFRTS